MSALHRVFTDCSRRSGRRTRYTESINTAALRVHVHVHDMEVVRIISYQLPGSSLTYILKLFSAQPTFAEIRRLLQKRNAPPNFFLAVQEPATKGWYQEEDFKVEGGVIPLWEPLLLMAVARKEYNEPEDSTRGKMRINGFWGPIWV